MRQPVDAAHLERARRELVAAMRVQIERFRLVGRVTEAGAITRVESLRRVLLAAAGLGLVAGLVLLLAQPVTPLMVALLAIYTGIGAVALGLYRVRRLVSVLFERRVEPFAEKTLGPLKPTVPADVEYRFEAKTCHITWSRAGAVLRTRAVDISKARFALEGGSVIALFNGSGSVRARVVLFCSEANLAELRAAIDALAIPRELLAARPTP